MLNPSIRSQLAEDNSSQWHANLNIVYICRDRATQIEKSFSQAPLKIQRPFYPEGKNICHSLILHTAGGIVGGDLLSQDLHLKTNAHAVITTVAAGKVYRSNGQVAKHNVKIKIDAEACLEFLPQETIVFDGAIYHQNLKVELAPGATWLGWEINRFGRSHRGEKFYSGEWLSHIEVWQQNQPLWIDRAWLPGDRALFNSANALAGKPVIGTLSWLGRSVSAETIAQIRDLWRQQNSQADAGVTELISGLLCRYRGDSTSEAKNWLIGVWHLLRQTYLQRSAIVPRVWQI
jgi:urease accessory protein